MNVTKKQSKAVSPKDFGIYDNWIADELVGIRTLERCLSKTLESPAQQNHQFLVNRLQDLNLRVQLLDRALDEIGPVYPAS